MGLELRSAEKRPIKMRRMRGIRSQTEENELRKPQGFFEF